MDADSLARLTEGQKDCLRRVFQHQTSKDIARALNISPHTVDMRLRTAAKTLGVASRVEAARLLAAYENLAPEPYQGPVYQFPELAPDVPAAFIANAAAGQPDVDRGGEQVRERQLAYQAAAPQPAPAIPLLLALGVGAREGMTLQQRLAWIAALTVVTAISFAMILAGLDALWSLLG